MTKAKAKARGQAKGQASLDGLVRARRRAGSTRNKALVPGKVTVDAVAAKKVVHRVGALALITGPLLARRRAAFRWLSRV